MRVFRSYRARLEATLVVLSMGAMGFMAWQASSRATHALRDATFDHLNGIREARALQIERYFQEASQHLAALAADATAHEALEAFRTGFRMLPEDTAEGARARALFDVYAALLTPVSARMGPRADVEAWFPTDGRTITLQSLFLAENPHPVRARDLLLNLPERSAYGDAHTTFHPTFHRYAGAFGFYDVFLIDGSTGQVLYSVFKEIDLGMRLTEGPYRNTGLARAFMGAMRLTTPGTTVLEDYQSYAPSGFAPAAFLAAPIWHGGVKVGVIAVQIAIDEVNRVMTAQGRWREEGLGETGHAYILGKDGSLRSDVRFELEDPETYLGVLKKAGIAPDLLNKVREDGTGVLNLTLPEDHVVTGPRDDPLHLQTVDFRDVSVLRTTSALNIAGLDWRIVAEIDAREAFAAVHALRDRLLTVTSVLAVLLLVLARVLASSATRPLAALAEGAKRLGGREFGTRVDVESEDEVGQLAAAFNRMAENLERTTVSREDLEVLAGKLITAQEEERKRIARDLHDDFSQRLAALAIEAGQVSQVTMPSDREHTGDVTPQDVQARLEGLKRGIAQLGDDIHGISRRLHPSTLEELGLVAAIETECRAFFERGGAPVTVEASGSFEHLAPEVALSLYRIVQEALRNVEKHADAQEVTVRLTRVGDAVNLGVSDNGRGFSPGLAKNKRGLGLSSIGERVRLIGGNLHIDATEGRGTQLSVRVPWRAA